MSFHFSGRNRDIGLRHEINVTPFVDVMLVLLIIFMVSAPLMTVGVSVDLPKGKAQAMPDTQPITLTLDGQGRLFLRDTEIANETLLSALEAIPEAKTDRIYLRADRSLSYSQVVSLMSAMANAGYTKIALVMEEVGK